MFATRFLSLVCTAASITILARLIPPADFGVWAMAAVPLSLATIMRELGLVPSIVQAGSIDLLLSHTLSRLHDIADGEDS